MVIQVVMQEGPHVNSGARVASAGERLTYHDSGGAGREHLAVVEVVGNDSVDCVHFGRRSVWKVWEGCFGFKISYKRA
jgi:hypothetical protein